MRLSPLLKGVIVALPASALIVRGNASFGRALAIAAGAACIGLAWILFSPSDLARASATEQAGCPEHRHDVAEPRIARRPAGRCARDVRCPASLATAQARRSTRR